MFKAKKLLSMALVGTLAVGVIGSGTLAYLQDSDDAVNVMTLGNVKIEQHEYQRETNADGTYKTDNIDGKPSYVLEEFEQGKPLLPIVGDPNEPGNSPAYAGYDATIVRMTQVDSYGSMQVFAGKNAQDKFVTVENTGKSDAYVRTLVAIEIGSTDGTLIGKSARAQEADGTGTQPWIVTEIGNIVIEGNTYMVSEYVYRGASDVNRHINGVLPAGETTYPSFCQVYLKHNATNEDMVAIDGNGNGMLDILVISQAVQVAGFDNAQTALDTAFGKTSEKATEWFGEENNTPVTVYSVEELQNALDAATEGNNMIILGADIVGDVTATQKSDVKIVLAGANHTFDGSVIVNGKSSRYKTAALTIQNVNFSADVLRNDAYINLGKEGDNNTRYTNNVTVSNCTFSGTGDTVAIKSYTGGDWNLTITGCTVNVGMHSMLQVTNVEQGLTITDCTVSSKNGININNTPCLNMNGCEFDTTGYCVRIGVNGSTNSGNFTIADSTLKSANDDGDAVIILRGTMNAANLTLEGNTTLEGNPEITGVANIVKK